MAKSRTTKTTSKTKVEDIPVNEPVEVQADKPLESAIKEVKLPEQLVINVLNYLKLKPYEEVASLINTIQLNVKPV